MKLEALIRSIPSIDSTAMTKAEARLDRLTKPLKSLGRLEELAARYVGMTAEVQPKLPKAVIYTFAADHGIASEGVSAYPRDVTAQMVFNFLRGGAGVNVLAAHVGADVRVVDIGVDHDFGVLPALLARKVARGTRNFAHTEAMSEREMHDAIDVGVTLATVAADEGVGILGTGDMGIGNTTPSAAITAVMTGQPVECVTGRGTGIDDAGLRHKIQVIERALAHHRPTAAEPLDVLRKVGGLEIAALAGLIVGAAARRVPIMLDGFIAGAAALIACALAPACREYLMASHLSVEQGHAAALSRLRLKPLLDLDLRLGEGTGACLGIGLVQAAIKIYTQMATFAEAGVSERSP